VDLQYCHKKYFSLQASLLYLFLGCVLYQQAVILLSSTNLKKKNYGTSEMLACMTYSQLQKLLFKGIAAVLLQLQQYNGMLIDSITAPRENSQQAEML